MKQTTVYLKEGTMATLRELAKRQGLTVSRGPGAGQLGNVSALLDKIAEESTMAKNLYEQAKERVMFDNTLAPFADFILADYPEGDEHWIWVRDASTEEIMDWVDASGIYETPASMDRTQQVGWLRHIAGEIVNDMVAGDYLISGIEAVAYWESNQPTDEMPEWFDDHDRALLAKMVENILAQ